MSSSLLAALDAFNSAKSQLPDSWTIDNLISTPISHTPPGISESFSELEKEFLHPSASFSPVWLNRLQCHWPSGMTVPPSDLFDIPPTRTQTRTTTRFTRQGLDGKVTGYRDVVVPASRLNATATNSTSMARRPAGVKTSVRGAAGFFPFAPGGLDATDTGSKLDEVESIAAAEERDILAGRAVPAGSKGLETVIKIGSGLLSVAPDFPRGLQLRSKEDSGEVEEMLSKNPDPVPVSMKDMEESLPQPDQKDDEESPECEDIDSLLPIEFPALLPQGDLVARAPPRKEWAHMVDINREMTDFYELVPEMARSWPFELDTFQKQAVYRLERGESVFVAAHTSAGKTVVAEYAIALAKKHMTKAIYTSPIKALSNQKFRDFRQTFDDVGILTGDVQINAEASCVVMTTEILRSMLYRGSDVIRDVEFVIFDEVHYVNDVERGVVWEEVIIMLPEHVTLILLSATVPNTYEFASWVGRTKKKDVYVLSTAKRPVPLEFFLWSKKTMHKIVSSDKKFLENGWKEANDILTGADKERERKEKEAQAQSQAQAQAQQAGRGGRGGRGGGPAPRGRGQAPARGGRGQPGAPRGQGTTRGNIARTGRGNERTTPAQDRTLWTTVLQYLRNQDLLPACIFVFSKKRCEENAEALSTQDFCTAAEKNAIHVMVEQSLARLRLEDRLLPQITRIRALLSRGIAVHHGGILPIVKELIEILFARGLVKVLFATETFAMGLNLPTRTVVFSGMRKHDGHSFRDLLPGEVTQMAGRAGRRGIDSVGTVIFVSPGGEAPSPARLRHMILGDPTKLQSQFRVTYAMMLSLLRVEAVKIEEMIRRSFSENAAQALLPQHEREVKLSQESLAKVKRESCQICDIDLERCHDLCDEYAARNTDVYRQIVSLGWANRVFRTKRIIIFKREGVRSIGMLLRDGVDVSLPDRPMVPIIDFCFDRIRTAADPLPFVRPFCQFLAPLPTTMTGISLRIVMVPLEDIDRVTVTTFNLNARSILSDMDATRAFAEDEIFPRFVPIEPSSQEGDVSSTNSWCRSDWDEMTFNRIRDLAFLDVIKARSEAAAELESVVSLTCPHFVPHYAAHHDEALVRRHIDDLRALMSAQNLRLLPDYEQRLSVLKDLGFVDANTRVLLKGKVACEIHSADALILTELILDNTLADFEPDEIVALLSCFVFGEKTETAPKLTARLETGKATIVKIAERVEKVQVDHQVVQASEDPNEFAAGARFGLVEVVYEWARGMSFRHIADLTDVMEGTIVRCITRLDETLREVRSAARLVGDQALGAKMDVCRELIGRDICAVGSLYV